MTTHVSCLKNTQTGQLFAYTDELAERPEMVPYQGPVMTAGQSPDVLASQRTLEENVAETDRKVSRLLEMQQGNLDQANVASAQERQRYEDENAALRAELAAMKEAQAQPQPIAEPAPAAKLAAPPENMQVVETNGTAQEVAPEQGQPAATPESDWALPENAQVIEHTDQPVVVTDGAPAVQVEAATARAATAEPAVVQTTPPVAQPVAVPIAENPAPVLPSAAQDVAAALK